jgi:hypothetical protein
MVCFTKGIKMGDWTIVIHGIGAHHNRENFDADEMAQEFVHELAMQGHKIKDAKFTYGGCNELVVKSSYPKAGLRGNPYLEKIEWTGKNWPDVFHFIQNKSDMQSYAVSPDSVLTMIVNDGRRLTAEAGCVITKHDNGMLFIYGPELKIPN